jgi:type I site-specific restriction-modification system R (restriction) subunit
MAGQTGNSWSTCGIRRRVSYGGTRRGKFFDHEEKRERDLILIDYEHPERNVYEVTEEFAYHNGHYGTRQDVVFDAPRR